MSQHLLAIDQGTTSTRAMIFTVDGVVVATHQLELTQHFPQPGWVEHDATEIWQAAKTCCEQALATAQLTATDIAAIGITNQRETTILWDKVNGEPLAPAIVWQDRRTAEHCQQLIAAGREQFVQQKTGLLLDPYFSATKLAWLLEHVPDARARAERGELAFGTVDSYLLWQLTEGRSHYTDVTNASRTLLFNIYESNWDAELLQLFNIPEQVLPEVLPSSGLFGETTLLGAAIPIMGMAGDQQAATVGQACFTPGMIKSTYGTGCFVMLNTGNEAIQSTHRLLSTIAYGLPRQLNYALEGSIFIAGATLQWLRDALHLFKKAAETASLAESVPDTQGVYLVPAFTGLGAPYWDPLARGAVLGLTRDTGIAHIVRAALEAVCYQTCDLLQAMVADGVATPTTLRVDGGMVANDWLLQFLADILQVPVERPAVIETTALGAAYLAGLGAGVYPSLQALSELWVCEQRFEPVMNSAQRETLYDGWLDAVERVRTQA